VIRLAAFLALVVGLTLAAYLAAVAIAFRMLGNPDPPTLSADHRRLLDDLEWLGL
jgi:hypothetical protein